MNLHLNRSVSILIFLFICQAASSQKTIEYNLAEWLQAGKFATHYGRINPLAGGDKPAVSLSGIAWLKSIDFTEGTIEVDLRGKDVFQQSFLGIAFHGVDSTRYDLIYFRPFNFRATDSVRRIHAVQYVSQPEHTWQVLREKFNAQYEKEISPAPLATDWFHARIVVKNNIVKVYVNGSSTPSLTVTKLNTRKNGKIGLWNDGQPGDFANLKITRD